MLIRVNSVTRLAYNLNTNQHNALLLILTQSECERQLILFQRLGAESMSLTLFALNIVVCTTGEVVLFDDSLVAQTYVLKLM